MHIKIKRSVKNYLKKNFNLEVKRVPDYERNKFIWIREMDIKTIFDIGANVGQFSLEICEVFPGMYVYAFEPVRTCYKELQKKMKKYVNHRSFPFALGESNGELSIYVSEFSPSSSLLKMSDAHKKAFPFTEKIKEEKVVIKTLDGIIEEMNLTIEDNMLIKIDVQGYEDKVITGGKNTISRAKVVITEVSFIELYDNQPLFDSLYIQLKNLGFKYAGNLQILFSPLNGMPLQADTLFIK